MLKRLVMVIALCAPVWFIAPAHAQLVFVPNGPFGATDPSLIGGDYAAAGYSGASRTFPFPWLHNPVITCRGDCNGDGAVTIDELVLGIAIAMGEESTTNCPAFSVTSVSSIVTAVTNSLDGCGER